MALIPKLTGRVKSVLPSSRPPTPRGEISWEVILADAIEPYSGNVHETPQTVFVIVPCDLVVGDLVSFYAFPLTVPNTWEAEGMYKHKEGANDRDIQPA